MKEEIIRQITNYMIAGPEHEYDFTRENAVRIHDIIWSEEFTDDDAELIREYLHHEIRPVSFGEYLQRYIYQKAQLPEEFGKVDLRTYQDLVLSEFRENHVPFSMEEVSTKPRAIVKGWLTHGIVRRQAVFLLGFGLKMRVEEVTGFLTKGIGEQDFDFNDPKEVIFWFCLKNHRSYGRAMSLLEAYQQLPEDTDTRDFGEETVMIRRHAMALPEQELMHFLAQLKGMHKEQVFSRTAKAQFLSLLNLAKMEAARITESSDTGKESLKSLAPVTNGELEKILYNGVALTSGGELKRIPDSGWIRRFASKRLTRHRIMKICRDELAVTRSDLITLYFFVHARWTELQPPIERFHRFIEGMNLRLNRCFMGDLNLSSPYEAFILLCLLSEWPLPAFSEVWEKTFELVEEEG